MGSCVRRFLCLYHSGALSQASGWSFVFFFYRVSPADPSFSTRPQFVPGWNTVVAAFRFVFSPFLQEGSLEEEIRALRHRVRWSLRLLIGEFTAALFVVTKASDGWWLIIVLFALISSMVVSEFRTPRLPEVGSPEASSCLQFPSAIVLASSSYMETFKHFVLVFLVVWAHGVDPSSLVL